ncbi:hypothetical protein FHG66_07065 [Rubellimicrobium rubrum]|uniref:Uncharacterized protein n=1 Tax=Rubellimicrobium rubrum TaxID=2585369 RepID=A0A5C4N363_9RHOB|nr:hypothetical protein [Rubellimicrobium rubrum]TNC50730.1 hypothetical protein FHG66_07065 [Rubellimicrobium rubrum]
MKFILVLMFSLMGAAAQAQSCAARVNSQELIIVPEAMGAPSPGLRERLRMWPSRTWDRTWGERVDCDSAAIVHFLATTMRLDQTEGYCLAEDDWHGWLLVPGARNYRGRCTKTVCDRVNVVAGGMELLGKTMMSLAAGRRVDSDSEAVTAVAHGTGAVLVSGQAPAVAASLGQSAATLGAALSVPAAAGAAAVTVIGVGGAFYLCS